MVESFSESVDVVPTIIMALGESNPAASRLSNCKLSLVWVIVSDHGTCVGLRARRRRAARADRRPLAAAVPARQRRAAA